MGAWAYCRHPGCGAPLDKPTAREVVEDEQRCAHEHANQATMTKGEFLIDLEARIVALEARIAKRGKR